MKYIIAAMLIFSLACVGSVLQVPTPTSTVTPRPPTLTPVVVETHLYKVSVDTLEIRAGAGEVSRNIGYLHSGDLVTVYRTQKTTLEKCSKWADIGRGRWVCFDRLTPVMQSMEKTGK